jgi:hypothetical protein
VENDMNQFNSPLEYLKAFSLAFASGVALVIALTEYVRFTNGGCRRWP